MDAFVFFAVLAAAAFHAGWNALLKVKLEPLTTVSLISAACGVVVLPVAFFVDLTELGAWPYLGMSLALHLVYYIALAEAYRFGDLSQVYPIARGSAPLMTALGASFWLGEPLGLTGWLGVILLGTGIIALSLRPRGSKLQAFQGRSVAFALLTALSIFQYAYPDHNTPAATRVSSAYRALFIHSFFPVLERITRSSPFISCRIMTSS